MWGPIGLRFIIDCDTFWGLMNMQWGRWCDLFLRPIPPFLRSVGSLPPIHYYPIYLMAFIGIRLLGAFCHLFRIDLPSPAVFHTLFALLLVHLHWVISICKFSVRFVKKLNSLWHNKQKKSPLVWLDLIVSEWI